MATEARYGWELPDLGDVADASLAFSQFASDISDTIADGTTTSYTPSWQTVPGQAWAGSPNTQPTGTTSRAGMYTVRNKECEVFARLFFGPNSYGAYGGLSIGLPVPASSAIPYYQQLSCILFTPDWGSSSWWGYGAIDPGGSVVRPHFPINRSRSDMLPWCSVAAAWTNSAIPHGPDNPGFSSIQNGGSIYVQGRYFVA